MYGNKRLRPPINIAFIECHKEVSHMFSDGSFTISKIKGSTAIIGARTTIPRKRIQTSGSSSSSTRNFAFSTYCSENSPHLNKISRARFAIDFCLRFSSSQFVLKCVTRLSMILITIFSCCSICYVCMSVVRR
jgi:hypothetical protein